MKTHLRKWKVGSKIQRLKKALDYGPKVEIETFLARCRYLQAAMSFPPLSGNEGPLDCFMLLNEPRLWEGVWSLHTFRKLFGPCRLIVLNDGSLRPDSIRTLERLFPGIAVPDVARNDSRVDAFLAQAGVPLCREWRRRFVFFRKLIDPVLLAQSDAILLLDSDVLHFRTPTEVRAWVSDPAGARYIVDPERYSYCAPPDVLRELCGAPLPEYFCAGYLCLPRGMVDLHRVERYLASDVFDSQRVAGKFNHVAEQTLYAMESGIAGSKSLPPDYATCPDPAKQDVVMGHFCGGEAPRTWFYTKGLRLLAGSSIAAV